ncbi:MAG: hypothetical protein OEX82_06675, partial [Nitrosomonas sp.]|nr:hypothetical protein [Nitrosomonas sp.]
MNISIINKKNTFQHALLTASLAASFLLVLCSQQAIAHTRLTVSSTPESSAGHGSTATELNIPHGCTDNPIIGNIFFLPDTADAIVHTSTASNFDPFEAPEGAAAIDHMVNPAYIRLIKSNDAFATTEFINDPLGNPIGFWAAGGEIPAHNWIGRVPMTITSVGIQPDSCATEVRLVPAIANICNVTTVAEIDGTDADNPNVDFWTAPDVGTIYDSPNWSHPASFTITRDLESNPLPASCGDGFAVRIVPSAAQLNRNMPVKIDGQQ